MMHAARIATSPRLRRTLKALQEAGGAVSSLELTVKAQTVAVGTCISELRANGAEITCRQEVREGRRVWLYTLVKSPEGHEE